MSERILTLRELNRATLARQMLLDRASFPALDAIERLVGLQAQLVDPPYIGLWTRLQSLSQRGLTALVENRQVVRATMMRATLHLMSARDYLLLRPALQPALTRSLHAFFSASKNYDIEQFVSAARSYVQEQPRTFAEIRSRLAELFPSVDPALMAYAVRTHLPLVQIPPGGTWGFTGNPLHSEASSWLDGEMGDPGEGLRLLILRYLAAFGPATVKDIQTWSGLTQLQSAVEVLRPELRTFRDEQSHLLFDLPDSPLPSEDTPAPPRFLPEFDNLLLSHTDRGRFVADEYRSEVFLTVGRVRATFLLDGFVRGTWKIERTKQAVKLVIEPFAPLSDEARAELVEEGERLLRFAEGDAQTFEVHMAQKG